MSINLIHKAIREFSDIIKEEGLPEQLPEKVFCPALIYDVSVDQARQFYPSIKFIRDSEIESLLTVARDPDEVN